MSWLQRVLIFGSGFVAGIATLVILMLVFGDYSDAPAVPVAPVVAQSLPTETPTTEPPLPTPLPSIDGGQVLAAFANAGIQLGNIDPAPKIDPDAPLPRSFRQNMAWTDALLGDKGGQLFVCDSLDDCKSISSYFKMFAGLAGPYIYTSPSGLVVVQLNSGFAPAQATRYQNALANY